MGKRRGSVLLWVLLIATGVATVHAVSKGSPPASEPAAESEREPDDEAAPADRAHLPTASRVTSQDGQVVVHLSDEDRERIGVETSRLVPKLHLTEVQAYGSVLDVARVTDLTNAYANARAQLQIAQAKVDVSRSANARARNLGQYATRVQVETAEGAFQTDQAALTAAQSQLRTLEATAKQEWGPIIGRAIVERSPLVTRLIERNDFLVQVTLPPGETIKEAPTVAYAELPPQSERIALRLVSPATRTEQRIQGVSYFYSVSGESGLLPGMSMLAFVTTDRGSKGIAVPESAVVHWQGGAWFYRRVGDDTFARHPLRANLPMADDCFVVDDIREATDVVTVGPQAVLSEELKAQLQAAGDADDD